MFIRNCALTALSLGFVAACGGSTETPPAPDQKNVQNQEFVAETSPPGQPVSADPGTSSPDPDEVAAVETELVNEFAGLPAPYNTADFTVGKRVFKQCSSCHLLEEDAGHLVGPNLHGLFGRTAGGVEDFTYSKALQEADFEWTPEQVDAWLQDPRGFLKGNRMSFSGVRKEKDRLAVVAYLMLKTEDTPSGE
jgi:cytochrome c